MSEYCSAIDPDMREVFNKQVDAIWDAYAITIDIFYEAKDLMETLNAKYRNADNTILLYLNLAAEFQNDREKCAEYLRIAQDNAIHYIEYLSYDDKMKDKITSSRIPQESIDQMKQIIDKYYDLRGLNLHVGRGKTHEILQNYVKRTMSGENIPEEEIPNYEREYRRIVAYFKVSYEAVKDMDPSKVDGYYKIPVEEYFAELKAFKDDPLKQSMVVMDFSIQTAISVCVKNFNSACRALTE